MPLFGPSRGRRPVMNLRRPSVSLRANGKKGRGMDGCGSSTGWQQVGLCCRWLRFAQTSGVNCTPVFRAKSLPSGCFAIHATVEPDPEQTFVRSPLDRL